MLKTMLYRLLPKSNAVNMLHLLKKQQISTLLTISSSSKPNSKQSSSNSSSAVKEDGEFWLNFCVCVWNVFKQDNKCYLKKKKRKTNWNNFPYICIWVAASLVHIRFIDMIFGESQGRASDLWSSAPQPSLSEQLWPEQMDNEIRRE